MHNDKMTAERVLPKPEDALAYLINRLVPPTSEDAASNVSRSIESLRQALSAQRVGRATLSIPDITCEIDKLGEWLCRDMERSALLKANGSYIEILNSSVLIRDVAKRIHFYRDEVLAGSHKPTSTDGTHKEETHSCTTTR